MPGSSRAFIPSPTLAAISRSKLQSLQHYFEQHLHNFFQGHHRKKERSHWNQARKRENNGCVVPSRQKAHFFDEEKLFPRSASDWISPLPSNSSSRGCGASIHFFWKGDVHSMANVPYFNSPDLFV